jgi:hypothetical protein
LVQQSVAVGQVAVEQQVALLVQTQHWLELLQPQVEAVDHMAAVEALVALVAEETG